MGSLLPDGCDSGAVRLWNRIDFHYLRLLGLVLMIWASDYLKVAENFTAQGILRKHAPYCFFQDALWDSRAQISESFRLAATGTSRVTEIGLLQFLLTSNCNFLGVDDDHIVSGVGRRSERGLIFSAQNSRNVGRKPSKPLSLGVNNVPFLSVLVHILRLGIPCFISGIRAKLFDDDARVSGDLREDRREIKSVCVVHCRFSGEGKVIVSQE
mmetsp:Transcript_10474/g.18336  ORF Transcript_10474/g.18336 Transcript_10474/m.18336 type:complete len:212 (-) Transcript_10474:194-829(-)